jgi:hypothetical protein
VQLREGGPAAALGLSLLELSSLELSSLLDEDVVTAAMLRTKASSSSPAAGIRPRGSRKFHGALSDMATGRGHQMAQKGARPSLAKCYPEPGSFSVGPALPRPIIHRRCRQ